MSGEAASEGMDPRGYGWGRKSSHEQIDRSDDEANEEKYKFTGGTKSAEGMQYQNLGQTVKSTPGSVSRKGGMLKTGLQQPGSYVQSKQMVFGADKKLVPAPDS